MAAILWGEPESDGEDPPFSLSSPRPGPADRFRAYVPDPDVVGPRRTAVGDGEEYLFEFREDHFVHIEIHHLAPSQLQNAIDLSLWLQRRGAVTVVTDDAEDNTYAGLKLKPGTKPEIRNDDEIRQHFSFSCDLRSSDPILIDYSA